VTPLGAVGRGALAGAIGTAAMDVLWFWRYRRHGGESRLLDWEFSRGLRDWDQAPAPARLGKQLYEGFFQRELPGDRAALTNNVMHWGYGIGWGALFGLVVGSARRPRMRFGLLFGPVVWGFDYVVLPQAKLYKPIWEYDLQTLWQDLSAHIVYGVMTAAVFRAAA
jgi:hypothetical protein